MYTIKPILLGIFDKHEKSVFTYRQNIGIQVDSPIFAFLIEGEGKTILVDSGPPNPDRAAKMTVRPIQHGAYLNRELEKMGVSIQNIDSIVLTHLHWDHSYNLELFPNVPIYVQKRELQYAIAPLPCDSKTYPYEPANGQPGWFEGFLQMKAVDGDYEMEKGINLILLPGHTPGIQGVLVDTDEGKILISSDHFPLYENFEQGIAAGIHIDLNEWYASLNKAKKICDAILPGHDMKILDRTIYGLRGKNFEEEKNG